MAIIGSILKTVIDLNQKIRLDRPPPIQQQREQLRRLLKQSSQTAFGKYYGFEQLLKAEDVEAAFKEEVPIFDYQRMNEQWWQRQQRFPDITWPGQPEYYALSSGTTGKSSKRLPITPAFLQSMREVGVSLVKALPNFDFPPELFEREILMLSSTANLDQHNRGHLEGEISGINVSNFPGWYDLFYRPGKEIAAIDNWDERVARIVEEAPKWDIGAIAGIPSWVLMMLREIVKGHGLANIHEIWPGLKVYASGGVAFETYRKAFDDICDQPIHIIDTYLASEGFFAYTARPDTLAMELALSHGYYYEFVPFDERGVDAYGDLLEDPLSLRLEEVELGKEYVLLISSCAGAWRYMIGDTIKFVQLDPPEIRLTGRTKFFLNVVGSQLSEEKLDAAIIELSQSHDMDIQEYSVAALQDDAGAYYHQWIVVSDESAETDTLIHDLDEALKDANKNYAVARTKALEDVRLQVIDKATYHDYLEQKKKKGGQIKTPKVMKAEAMEQYLAFLQA